MHSELGAPAVKVRPGESGIVGILVTLVVLFAIVLAVELTRTLVAIQQIRVTVRESTRVATEANGDLDTGCGLSTHCSFSLPEFDQTDAIVQQLAIAAHPLSGEMGQILGAVDNINTTASSILANATSINTTVHSVNNLVGSINTVVHSTAATFDGVNSAVWSIAQSLVADNQKTEALVAVVDGIKADIGIIDADAGGLLVQVEAICGNSVGSSVLRVNAGLLQIC